MLRDVNATVLRVQLGPGIHPPLASAGVGLRALENALGNEIRSPFESAVLGT